MDKTTLAERLPELPEPASYDPGRFGAIYTADQMHEYAARAVREAGADGWVDGFVEGAKWWEWAARGATMWQSDQARAYVEGKSKFAAKCAAAPTQDQEKGEGA